MACRSPLLQVVIDEFGSRCGAPLFHITCPGMPPLSPNETSILKPILEAQYGRPAHSRINIFANAWEVVGEDFGGLSAESARCCAS